jgi:hypothetical protein
MKSMGLARPLSLMNKGASIPGVPITLKHNSNRIVLSGKSSPITLGEDQSTLIISLLVGGKGPITSAEVKLGNPLTVVLGLTYSNTRLSKFTANTNMTISLKLVTRIGKQNSAPVSNVSVSGINNSTPPGGQS